RASIPVMEGKAVLFKEFGDVEAWPVPLENVRVNGKYGRTSVDKVIKAVTAISPMYGGINLEDIAAPECFEIEEKLEQSLDIPVFHDDQWGTAIIVVAATKNYCLLSNKKIENLNIVINGAGAAGIRTADMLKESGAKDITLVDSKGVIHQGRQDLNMQKLGYAIKTNKRTLEDAMKGSDMFIGVSVANCVKPKMVKSMNVYPAIFAMANPTPEIMPEKVKKAMGKKPYIMATGRSDYPNQINNVLGFPYIFRGVLKTRASHITISMKLAASNALAQLARKSEGLPEEVKKAYGHDFEFGPEYIIPVPFDPRLRDYVSEAVAKAAITDGVNKLDKKKIKL
ncbi:malate dehydrogenase, partial [Candidatus Woesearchaeota archaeon]|nr:malate dehydrogenase [Candidatus Woesearchaeota archaeon]